MRRLILCLTLFVLGSAGEAFPGTPLAEGGRHVRRVEFHGAGAIAREDLLARMALRPSGHFRKVGFARGEFERDLDRILRCYRADGFSQCVVRGMVDTLTVADDEADLHILVEEGARALLGEIRFEVRGTAHRDPVLLHEMRTAWQLQTGTPYRPLEVENARRSVLRIAHAWGYLDAEVTVEIRRHADRIEVRALVRSESVARVHSVEVTGLRKTQGRFVLREIELHPGDPILPSVIERSRRNLIRTGLFQDVTLTTAPEDSGVTAKRLVVHAVDRKTGSLSSGIGYGLIDRLHFVASLEQENYQGRGIRLQLDGIYAGRHRRLEGGAVFPWTLGHRLTSRLAAGYEKSLPRSFESESWHTAFSLSRSVNTNWKTEVGYRLARVDIRRPAVLPERTRIGQLELALSRDSRTDLLGRPRGSFLRASEEWVAPWLGSREHFGRTKLQYRLDRPIRGSLALAFRVLAGHLFSQDSGRPIPITERFFAGGASTLRGFLPDAVGPTDSLGVALGGNVLVLGVGELEVRLKGAVGVAGFIDAGQLEDEVSDFRWNLVSVGAGFGLRARPKFGTFRADIGFPVTSRFGGAPQFHFATGTAFF